MRDDYNSREDEKIYKILSHKVRRKIIQLIGDSGTSTYTEIAREVDLEPGTLYHHIDYLKEYVEQDQQKRYRLTPLGQAAYRLIHDGKLMVHSSSKSKAGGSRLSDLISLGPLYRYAAENPLRLLPEVIIILAALSYLTVASGLSNFGLFYSNISVLEPLIKVGLVFATWISLILVTEVICRLGLHASENLKALSVNITLSMIPYLIFLSIYTLLNQLIPIPDPLQNPAAMIGLIGTHIWFLAAFTRGIQYAKKVARSYAAMIGLACYYINVVALIVVVL
ncbi:MAG: winged helix-turn-helix domain-containing protein [Candidatus Odinarchaeum yellowstonii]|uniref:Winged helix-turn-helix domain-containing protein n=1 Tax=Odinarchaeota yellowstonii (strain LCB_4) TaxID=1841599 RepID=A0AAF0IC72_ODILC|nr:MAG: winged helix-turn-helix domain-containing protein [Candidatus Odinarchaeum yellowstonii]